MKIPAKFWESLGQYQYGYWPDGIFDISIAPKYRGEYIGRGQKDRCVDHLINKDVNINDLVIIGRNTEKFTVEREATAAVQAACESLLITLFDPKLNKIAGMYSHTWCRMRVLDLYAEWQKQQINIPDEQQKFYSLYGTYIRDHIKSSQSTGQQFTYHSKSGNSTEYHLTIVPTIAGYIPTVKVKFNKPAGLERETLKEQWLQDNPLVESETNGEYLHINGLSIDDAIELWVS
tara:strand:+ start:1204 stop:1902 length:699 start_codon:yes stop_codon:yes gene_type:complete